MNRIVVFDSSQHAQWAEEVARAKGFAVEVIPAPQGTDQQIFEKHLSPWIGRFFADLERAEAADLYRRIGTLGRVFMEVEKEAFALPS